MLTSRLNRIITYWWIWEYPFICPISGFYDELKLFFVIYWIIWGITAYFSPNILTSRLNTPGEFREIHLSILFRFLQWIQIFPAHLLDYLRLYLIFLPLYILTSRLNTLLCWKLSHFLFFAYMNIPTWYFPIPLTTYVRKGASIYITCYIMGLISCTSPKIHWNARRGVWGKTC